MTIARVDQTTWTIAPDRESAVGPETVVRLGGGEVALELQWEKEAGIRLEVHAASIVVSAADVALLAEVAYALIDNAPHPLDDAMEVGQ